MRKIDSIIFHCSDTDITQDIGVAEIASWHRKRGFSDCGYHFIIRRNGCIEIGRPIEKVGAHCKHHNLTSIGICLVGGRINGESVLDGSWLSVEQCRVMLLLTNYLMSCFPITKIAGHNEFNGSKTCPNFDVSLFVKFLNSYYHA